MNLQTALLSALAMSSLFSVASAQRSLTPPQIGFAQDSSGGIRPLLGISGNFWLGEAVARGARTAASSGCATMVKTRAEVQVYDALGHLQGQSFPASGDANFAFTNAGVPALAWLPSSAVLLRWTGTYFESVRLLAGPSGDVISLAAPSAETAAFLVSRGGVLWRTDISLSNGGVTFDSVVPGAGAPALLWNDGTVIHAAVGAVVVRSPRGAERRIAIAGHPLSFSLLGEDWIRIVCESPGRAYALRLSTGGLFLLPEVSR